MEEKVLNAYLGEKKEKYEKQTNFAAAFFGPLWFLYKKCYLVGMLLYLFASGPMLIKMINPVNISEVTPDFLTSTTKYTGSLNLILFFVYLFFANKIYIWDAKRKVEKIIAENPQASEEQITEIGRKKGGNNVAIVVIFAIILILGLIATSAMFLYFWDQLSRIEG
jgi:hypothetical protein